MANNNTLQTSINWVTAYVNYTVPTVGQLNEPALSSANMTKQTILGPPFKWAWNRNKVTFTITSGTQDYVVSIPDFGYMELATFQPTGGGKILQFPKIFNTEPLSESSDSQQPVSIAALTNDGNGNIKFRIMGVPDQSYTVVVTYQSAPSLFGQLTDKWAPIPDYFLRIYNRGLLALIYEAMGDPRAQQEKISFAASLLAEAGGLTETEKNVFLTQYLGNSAQIQTLTAKTTQSVQARGQ